MDKEFLSAPIKSTVDKFQLIPEFLKVRGLVKEHLDSYNYFVTTGIKKIVRVNNEIRSSIHPHMYLNYAAPIKAHIEFTYGSADNPLKREKQDVIIGKMPVMLRSQCCVLYGKDEAELANFGECPLDPGGYFVVKGNEKVILIQEQLSNNRIIIDIDKKQNLIASVTSSTAALRSKTVIVMEKEKIYLQLNQFQTKVPMIVVMKAMGMESDQEIVQMIGRDPRYSDLLLPSMEECKACGVDTQRQALEFLEKKVKKPQYSGPSTEKDNKAWIILRDVFIAHVPVNCVDWIFKI